MHSRKPPVSPTIFIGTGVSSGLLSSRLSILNFAWQGSFWHLVYYNLSFKATSKVKTRQRSDLTTPASSTCWDFLSPAPWRTTGKAHATSKSTLGGVMNVVRRRGRRPSLLLSPYKGQQRGEAGKTAPQNLRSMQELTSDRAKTRCSCTCRS